MEMGAYRAQSSTERERERNHDGNSRQLEKREKLEIQNCARGAIGNSASTPVLVLVERATGFRVREADLSIECSLRSHSSQRSLFRARLTRTSSIFGRKLQYFLSFKCIQANEQIK